jgi:hypothetical protein
MRKWLGFLVSVVMVGCINTSVRSMDPAVRPARSTDAVTVLLERPRQPYTVIAVVESKTETVFDSFDDLRRAMVAEAAELGGEALILGPEVSDHDFIFTGIVMIRSERRALTGEVIVYERGG